VYENLTEDQIEDLMGAVENMIAWTKPLADANPDFRTIRNAACAALTAAIKTVDAEG
jgi:hypothetical protein